MRYISLLAVFIQSLTIHAQRQVPKVPMAEAAEVKYEVANPDQFETSILSNWSASEVLRYEKLEIGITLPMEINYKVRNFTDKRENPGRINPYLEWELKVEALFILKNSSDTIVADGFFMKNYRSYMSKHLPYPKNGQAYSDEEYNALGGWEETYNDYPFRVRFAPPETGLWKYIVRITTPEKVIYGAEKWFEVIESDNKGYIKVNKNGRFLELGQESFYPVGMNAQWPESHQVFDSAFYQYNISKDNGVTYYRPEMYRTGVCAPRVYGKYKEVLGKMNDAGVNYFRTIMNPVSTEIEWETLGDYTKRLPQAQEMDAILKFAEERNMYIHWDMATHYTFKYNVYSIAYWDWIDSDGTPSYAYKDSFKLDHPTDFFTNEQAKKYYKQRLRYIVSRWGYSTSIAVFELMCEISNIGSEKDDNDAYYHAHHQLYEDWQLEMGTYIKSLYNGRIHLLTASYSGEKHKEDRTFAAPAFDLMTSNIYDFQQPDFSSFFSKFISRRFLNESPGNARENVYTMECTGEGADMKCTWKIKPLLFSETDPADAMQNCQKTAVEMNRSIWQSLFSGLAASLSWSSWYYTDNYAIYGQMKQFISGTDLGNGNWHPGASQLVARDSLKLWEYSASYAAAMNSSTSKADIAYLRSGDLASAIGVLTNKTYNAYNADSCLAIPPAIAYLQNRQTVFPAMENLEVKGLAKGRYVIEYFLPGNQREPIFTSEQKGSSVEIDLPYLPATKEGYIVLFRVRKI